MVGFDWGAICRAAGITPGGGLTTGTWNGLEVRVTVHGAARGLQVALRPPLDVGAQVVVRRGGLDSPARTGEARFDDAFVIFADEPERGRALVTPGVRAALLEIRGAGREAGIEDDFVWVELERSNLEAQVLWALPVGARLATLVNEARSSVPPPADLLAQVPAWQALASELGLVLQGTPPRLAGALGGCRFELIALRTGQSRHEIEARITPEPALDLGLELTPQGLLGGLFGQDVKIGDASLDAAFVIRAASAEHARRLLDDQVRPRLLELRAAATRVELAEGRLTLRAAVLRGDAQGGPALVRTACAAMARMAANA